MGAYVAPKEEPEYWARSDKNTYFVDSLKGGAPMGLIDPSMVSLFDELILLTRS